VITLSKEVEEDIKKAIIETERGRQFAMEPTAQRKLIERISEEGTKARQQGIKPVFLTSPDIRALFRTIVANVVPNAAVLSSFEIVPDVRLESVGTIAY
jgi:flagellar biosynthesis component FlhA